MFLQQFCMDFYCVPEYLKLRTRSSHAAVFILVRNPSLSPTYHMSAFRVTVVTGWSLNWFVRILALVGLLSNSVIYIECMWRGESMLVCSLLSSDFLEASSLNHVDIESGDALFHFKCLLFLLSWEIILTDVRVHFNSEFWYYENIWCHVKKEKSGCKGSSSSRQVDSRLFLYYT